MAVATWQQVAVALGRPTSSFKPDQQAQITWWLNGVELIIKERLGEVSQLDQPSLVYVEVEAVAARVPPVGSKGESSVTVTADDGSVTRRWEKGPLTANDIKGDWWSLLSPGLDSSAFTIRTYPQRQHALNASEECW